MINLRYEILEQLGKGRSTVFLCKDIDMPGSEFAMKILPPNVEEYEKEKFIKEYFTLKNLEHPNIIKAFDQGTIYKTDEEAGIEVGSTFITLEHFEGEELLSNGVIANEQNLKEIIKQICEALYYLHQSKYIYYDLKPENILVSQQDTNPQIRLIDLGLAEYSPSSSDYEIKGTAHYIAPELLKKEKHNHLVDLYSLGMIMYRLIYCKFPFDAKAELDIYKAAIEDDYNFPDIENYSGNLIQIVKKLLHKDVDVRYKSALSVIHDLGFPINIETTKDFLPARIYSGRNAVIEQILSYLEDKESNEVFTIRGFEGVGKSSLFHKITELKRDTVLITNLKGKSLQDLMKYILRQIIFSDSVYSSLSEKNREYFFNVLKPDSTAVLDEFKSSIAMLSSASTFILLLDDFNNYEQLLSNLLLEIVPILQVNNIKILLAESSEHEFLSDKINNVSEIILGPFNIQELNNFLDESYYSEFPVTALKSLIIKNADLIPGNIKSFINDLILFGIMNFTKEGVIFNDEEDKIAAISEAHFAVYDLRLANITKEELKAVQLLSAFEIYIDYNLLLEILGLQEKDFRKMITNLQLNNIMQKPAAGQILMYSSEALKNYIYAGIEDKKNLHSIIAFKLKEKFSNNNRLELARHYELASEFESCYNITLEEVIDAEKHSAFSYIQKVLLHLIELPLLKDQLNLAKIKLCEVYLKLGDAQSALSIVQDLKSQPIQRKFENRLFILEGSALIASGDFANGKNIISNLLKELTDKDEINNLKVELAYADFELKLYDEAVKECNKLLNDNSFTAELKGRCYNLLGMINIFQNNDLNSALKNFLHAKDQFEKSKLPVRISGAEVNIGNVYNILSKFDKAEEHWQIASRINQSIGNLEQEGILQQNLGVFYYDRAKFNLAISSYQKAKNIFFSLGNELGYAQNLWNLSEVYISICEYQESLNNLLEAERIFEKNKNFKELSDVLFLLGKIYFKIDSQQMLEEMLRKYKNVIKRFDANNISETNKLFLDQLIIFKKNKELTVKNLTVIQKEFYFQNENTNYMEVTFLLIDYFIKSKSFEIAFTYLNSPEFIELCSQNSILEAQREYFLGISSKKMKSDKLLPPLVYFEKAYDLIKDEYITELTWKILYEISELYIERGNLTKAKFFVTYTRELIYYIGEKIESPHLRAAYLRNPERMLTLKKLESFYPSN